MKKILILYLFNSLASTLAWGDSAFTGVRENITGLEITAEMAPGVNLWNTLDAHGCGNGLAEETCWGNPVTTLEMISDMADRGFKTLRIPVTWYPHLGPAPDYLIDEAWLDRVEEVANYAFTNDMYVIINIHHDDYDPNDPDSGKWLATTYERRDQTVDQLEKVWTQIANRFIDYGDYLIFETMNEPRAVGTPQEWSGGTAENRDVINQLNLAAVNAIRATGGNNAARFIMTPQYAGDGNIAATDLIIPNDDDRVIVSVHNYFPFSFTLLPLTDGGIDAWGTNAEKKQLIDSIKVYYDAFTSQGRAVILGEWGADSRNDLATREDYYEVFSAACALYQITSIAWIYDYERSTRTWRNPILEDAILNPPTDALEFDPVSLPARIEAEDYFTQFGIQTELTSDIGGGSTVAFIESGDFVEFNVDVATDGEYDFDFRVASGGTGGTIDILIDEVKVSEVSVPLTGGWQDYRTVSIPVNLDNGEQTLRLSFIGGSGFLFNLNWFEVAQRGTSSSTSSSSSSSTSSSSSSSSSSSGASSSGGGGPISFSIFLLLMLMASYGLSSKIIVNRGISGHE